MVLGEEIRLWSSGTIGSSRGSYFGLRGDLSRLLKSDNVEPDNSDVDNVPLGGFTIGVLGVVIGTVDLGFSSSWGLLT